VFGRKLTGWLRAAAIGVDARDGEAALLEFEPPAGGAGTEADGEEGGDDSENEEVCGKVDEKNAEEGTASAWRSVGGHERS
jgi:hypothetical protein